jgi:K+-transporting ATPase KdpF subunit
VADGKPCPAIKPVRGGRTRDGLLVCAPDDRGVRLAGAHRAGSGKAVTAENLIGLILAILLVVFLIVALIFPEKF